MLGVTSAALKKSYKTAKPYLEFNINKCKGVYSDSRLAGSNREHFLRAIWKRMVIEMDTLQQAIDMKTRGRSPVLNFIQAPFTDMNLIQTSLERAYHYFDNMPFLTQIRLYNLGVDPRLLRNKQYQNFVMNHHDPKNIVDEVTHLNPRRSLSSVTNTAFINVINKRREDPENKANNFKKFIHEQSQRHDRLGMGAR